MSGQSAFPCFDDVALWLRHRTWGEDWEAACWNPCSGSNPLLPPLLSRREGLSVSSPLDETKHWGPISYSPAHLFFIANHGHGEKPLPWQNSVEILPTSGISLYYRLASLTVAAVLLHGKWPKFPVGESPKGTVSCLKTNCFWAFPYSRRIWIVHFLWHALECALNQKLCCVSIF